MKKIIFLLAIGLTLGMNAQAQKKTGYINSQELLSLMPEYEQANTTIQKYVQSLDEQYKIMVTDGQKKFQEYQENESTWSAAVKETKEKELNDLQNQMAEFQQSAEMKVAEKRSEVFKPLIEKAQNAIQAVGQEGGYDYIFDSSAILYAKDSENILSKVKTKLGIK